MTHTVKIFAKSTSTGRIVTGSINYIGTTADGKKVAKDWTRNTRGFIYVGSKVTS